MRRSIVASRRARPAGRAPPPARGARPNSSSCTTPPRRWAARRASRPLRVVTLEGTGTQYNLGQDLRPGLADQTFTVSAFKREIEVDGPRMRTTQTRTPNFAYFQGPQAQTQVQGVDGEMAYNVGANGTATRSSARVAADRRAEQLHHPLRLLRAGRWPPTPSCRRYAPRAPSA